MIQRYPVRHPPVPEAARRGELTPEAGSATLPHERDESSQGQASATPQHREQGERAYRNATDGTADTDRGPVADQVYNDKVAPDRSSGAPRR